MADTAGTPVALQQLAEHIRSVHVRMLQSAGLSSAKGSCLFAAVLLAEAVRKFGACERVTIRGGDGAGDGGYQDAAGQRHGHYWVEAQTGEETVVLDVTADQFGGLPITVLPLSVAKAYQAGSQKTTDAHIAEFGQELASNS